MPAPTPTDPLIAAITALDAGALAEARAHAAPLVALPQDPIRAARARAVLGLADWRDGALGAARAHLEAAAALAPDDGEIAHHLGRLALTQGDLAAAAAHLARALAAMPGAVAVMLSSARLFERTGRWPAVAAMAERVVVADPGSAAGWHYRGLAALEAGDLRAAVADLTRACALAPDDPLARTRLAAGLRRLGRGRAAHAQLSQAADGAPDQPEFRSFELSSLLFQDGQDRAALLAAHRRFGDGLADRSRPRPAVADRPVLRVGYIGPGFSRHITAESLRPVVRHHDRAGFSVHLFAQVPRPDAATAEFQALADSYHDISGLSDAQAAALIAQQGIDILVETIGHWDGNRLGVLAYRPAPVQASYLCNAPTTGLATVDCLITHRDLDPDGKLAAYCTETPAYLPGAMHAVEFRHQPPLAPPPSHRGARLTFGCFANPGKIGPSCMALWAAVLRAVPEARLLVKGRDFAAPERATALRNGLEKHGVAPARVTALARTDSFADHMALYNQIDIALDTAPFTGGRTTLDALWMGVPVITLSGRAIHERLATHFLTTGAGLGDLCATDPRTYRDLAVGLAADVDRRGRLRRELRDRLRASPFWDATGHVRELEALYRRLWQAAASASPR